MAFQVIHPRSFPERYNLAHSPSRATLLRWKRELGFPKSLRIPIGYYVQAEVDQWFEERANAKRAIRSSRPASEAVRHG